MFNVGQRIICIDDGLDRVANSPLRKGTVYTVKAIWLSPWDQKPDAPTIEALLLDEVSPPPDSGGFAGPCFRPLSESRLAIFRSMLAPMPTKENV